MKKTIGIILFAYFLLFSLPTTVVADEAISEGPRVIEFMDIPTLLVAPEEGFLALDIAPKPTPPVPEETKEANGEDTRGWTQSPYSDLIAQTAKTYDLDPQVIYATIMTESDGNPFAFRYEPALKDASLCMGQILISTARSLGFEGDPKEMYKPDVCIDLIGKYHRNMLDSYGELSPVELAKAYNSGSPWGRPVRGHVARFSDWMAQQNLEFRIEN